MAEQDKATLKQSFQTGDSPTGSDFANLIDSQLNLAENVEQTINGAVNFAGGIAFASVSAAVVNGTAGTFGTLTTSNAQITGGDIANVALSNVSGRFVELGYSPGVGATATQAGAKTAAVAINALCGTITMNNATLNRVTGVSFTMDNSRLGSTDVIIANIAGGATSAAYTLNVSKIAAGSAQFSLYNLLSGTDLSEAVQIRFAIIKAVAT